MSEQVDQKELDVIVIGAGPAGGQCARELAKLGRRVVLLERSQEIGEPNYSSAGTCSEILERFDLPLSVTSAPWNRILFRSKNAEASWAFGETRGYVLDFMALRKFLAEEAARHGADILVGSTVTDFIEDPILGFSGVKYKGIFSEGILRARVIVDASGHWGFAQSKLHLNSLSDNDSASALELQMAAIPPGMEKTLAFFFGTVATNGYGWVFPMEQGKAAKLGFGVASGTKSARPIKQLLEQFVAGFNDIRHLEPTEIHGGGGHIADGSQAHVSKNVVCIGDAAQQVNPLAYEGIRHAMGAGQLAAQIINRALQNNDLGALKTEYEKAWRQQFRLPWFLSYHISHLWYEHFTESDWDRLVRELSHLTPEHAFDLFFNYHFKHVLRSPKLMGLFGGKWLLTHLHTLPTSPGREPAG